MFVSLNEIDVSAKRAARGIGLSWGLAEEAGKAARYLGSHGLPALENLLALLRHEDGVAHSGLTPRIVGSEWHAQESFICPLLAGAALADDAAEFAGLPALKLSRVRAPLLLLPFLAQAAVRQHENIHVAWSAAAADCNADGSLAVSGDTVATEPGDIQIAFGAKPSIAAPRRERLEAVAVNALLWQELQKLAARTYVPASEHSRLMGAGAGLSDND